MLSGKCVMYVKSMNITVLPAVYSSTAREVYHLYNEALCEFPLLLLLVSLLFFGKFAAKKTKNSEIDCDGCVYALRTTLIRISLFVDVVDFNS